MGFRVTSLGHNGRDAPLEEHSSEVRFETLNTRKPLSHQTDIRQYGQIKDTMKRHPSRHNIFVRLCQGPTIIAPARVVLSDVAALIIYRKCAADLIWHFDPDCSLWPVELYEQVISRIPPQGAFCRRCAHMCIEKFRFSWSTWFILRVG